MKLNKRAGVLLSAVLLFAFGAGLAQPKAIVQHYSTESGLSHITVSCMLKDRQGFMWFGTWDGINRFDGRNFTSYKSFPGDDSPLQSHRIEQILEGDGDALCLKAFDRQIYRFTKSSGTFEPLATIFLQKERKKYEFTSIIKAKDNALWLRTFNDGIIYFPDAKNQRNTYFHFTQSAKLPYKLPSNKINFFHADSSKQMWIGTPNGVVCLTKRADKSYKVSAAKPIIAGNVIDAEEDANILYFTTDEGLLYFFSKKTRKLTSQKVSNSGLSHAMVSKSKSLLYLTTNSGQLIELQLATGKTDILATANQPLRSLHEDSEGNIWLEPTNPGVLRFDPHTRQLKSYRQESDIKYKLSGNRFRVFEDDRKRVWVNMKSGGFGYFDKKNDRIAYFFDNPNDKDRKFSNNVVSFLYDAAGVMWLASDEKGMEKIVFQENDFNQQLLVTPERWRSDNEVRGLAIDRKRRLWVGAKSGKIYLIQNGLKRNNFITNMPADGLGQVYSIRQDASGAVWLGTKADGLYRLDPVSADENSYKLTHFAAGQPNANSLISNEIYSTIQDNYGRTWVGTYGKGVQVMVPENVGYRFIAQAELFGKHPPAAFNKVRQLTFDKDGRIWAATTDGLMIIETGEDVTRCRFKTYSKQAGKVNSLANNDVQYVYKDARGKMWLATAGGGLSLAIGSAPLQALNFKNYTTRDGLANGYIVSITEGNDGNLWLASQSVITRFNTATGNVRNYTSLDGVPKAIFSESACVRSGNDSLIFGTTNGLVTFSPARIKDHRINAPLQFTDIQVNNEKIGTAASNVTLPHELNGIKQLNLKYNQNVLNFDFGVLDYRSNDKQVYAYRLNGFDSTWHSSEGQPRATYTNLPPGKYTFEVRCLSNGLYTNVPYKSINITIAPPLWRTWWAYLIYTILLGVVLAFIRRTFITMMNLRNKIAVEQELAALKMQFFTNVSHELRTPLTLIVNPINAIAESETLSAKGKSYVQTVQRNADRMVRFINQLLDLRKVESGSATLNRSNVEIVAFIRDIAKHFDGIAEEKKINFKLLTPVDAITVGLDPDKFETVIYNILGNAFKFSPAKKTITVKIDVDTLNSRLIIRIKDQAGGIPETELPNIFKLFYEGAGTHSNKGTGIGLALAKEFVALHHGEIHAENNDEGGLTVSILLTIENSSQPSKPAKTTLLAQTDNETINGQPLPEIHQDEADKALILLVEDNPELNQFLATQLSDLYRVVVAENGLQGLELANKHHPDLILSDVMMPEMDGLEMLEKLKADANTSHIPVILLSARHSIESQITGLKHGADYYITKPFNNQFLLATINSIITKRKQLFEQMLTAKKRPEINPSEIVITTHDEAFLQKVIKMVEEKMTDPEFRITDLVSSMNMSRTAFYNKFKSLTDTSPVEFLREMRLKRGKQYLDAGETNISTIAYNVGFENVRYFSSCFKEYYRKSPTEYLKEQGVNH